MPLAKKGMQYFMDRYKLQKLETLGRNYNRVARLFAAMLGFKKEGVLKKHGAHGGVWVDYYIGPLVEFDQ